MIRRIFPFLSWFDSYNSQCFRHDLVSGLTVALVLIPQSMAYAELAGLPSYYGLYAAFLPPMIASLFGSSRQLATGPVAIVSLMTAASLEPLATTGSDGYITYAILLALMVGVFQLALGVLRLGIIVNFLSHPVVNGFTNAAAIIIATSQLSKLFGVHVDKAEHHYETIIRVCKAATVYSHWPTLAMGMFAFALMFALKRLYPKIPNVFVAVVLTTLISWHFGFRHDLNVDISAFDSPGVRQMITQFNKEVSKIKPFSEQRIVKNDELSQARKKRSKLGVIEAKYEISVLTHEIDTYKLNASRDRKQIRGYMFTGVKQPDDSLKFYLHDQLPDGLQGDARTWRIKVKNTPLDVKELRILGGGAVVGVIPQGLPSISVPRIDFKAIGSLLPFAMIISLLGFMEAISIAKAMAAKTGQRLDPNQELIGQGLANILGSASSSYPTSGSFSRSAVNLQTGAISGLSSVFTSLMVVVVLIFFTPLLYHLPQAVLAAVIMMAVIGLINFTGFIHAWRAQWYDGVISVITFISTLIFAPHLDKGIIIGVGLSLMVFLYKSMHPTVATLSRRADRAFRDISAYKLKECAHISMVRFDGPLFFANASYLEDRIIERIQAKKHLRHILIVANGINDMDASGEETFSQIIDRIRNAGIKISMSGVNESVIALFKRTNLLGKISKDNIYPTMEFAINAIHGDAHIDSQEEYCPLEQVCYDS
jgi:sulfate permease, SulP family